MAGGRVSREILPTQGWGKRCGEGGLESGLIAAVMVWDRRPLGAPHMEHGLTNVQEGRTDVEYLQVSKSKGGFRV